MKKIYLIFAIIVLLLTTACGSINKKGGDIKLGDTMSNEYMQITLNEVGIYDNLSFISNGLKDTDNEKYISISYTYKNLDQYVETHSNWVEIGLCSNKEEYSYIKHYSVDDSGNFYSDDFIDVEPLEEREIFSVIKVPNEVVENIDGITLNIKVGNVTHKYIDTIENLGDYIKIAEKSLGDFEKLYYGYLLSTNSNSLNDWITKPTNIELINNCINSFTSINTPKSQTHITETLLNIMKEYQAMATTGSSMDQTPKQWINEISELSTKPSWISKHAKEFVNKSEAIILQGITSSTEEYFN